MGNVTFGQGSLSSASVPGEMLEVQSGTMIASLAGSAGLNKTGAGTVTLAGSNSYHGGTTVSAGTLNVTTAAALPAGTALTVGAGGTFVFDPSIALSPAVLSSNSAAAGALPAAANGASLVGPTANTDAAAVTPLQGLALVSAPTPRSLSASTAPAFLPATLLPALPAVLPSSVASDTLWASYPQATGSAGVRASGAAGYLAWLNSSVQSSNAGESAAETNRRIAALDAVLTQYGSP